MSRIPPLVEVPTAKDKMVAELEKFKREFEVLKEFKRLDAELKRTHYLALIEQGFTPSEALFIVMKG